MTTRKELVDDLINTLQEIKKQSHPMTESHRIASQKLDDLGVDGSNSVQAIPQAV